MILCLFDKTGDNVVLLKTEEVKSIMEDTSAKLVDIAPIIVKRWAVEFLKDEVSS